MHLQHLWIATRTLDVEHGGTDDTPQIVIDGPGGPFSFLDLPYTDRHRGRGKAGLARITVGDLGFLPEELEYSIAAGGRDRWALDHATAWGERAESGAVVPLGFGAAPALSRDADEGLPAFTPDPVASGTLDTPIRRLLVILHTHPAIGFPPREFAGAGTNARVNLQIASASGIRASCDLPSTSQSDRSAFHANYYLLPVASPFTRRELTAESIVLSTLGTDPWFPAVVVVFGVESLRLTGTPSLVPLVHLAPWPFAALSTEPDRGLAFERLPLAPMDDPGPLRPRTPVDDVILFGRLQRRLRELERRVEQATTASDARRRNGALGWEGDRAGSRAASPS